MHPTLNRRQFLAAGALTFAAAGLAGCSSTSTSKTTSFVKPGSTAVTAAEAKRRSTGAVVKRALTAEPVTLDLGGKTAKTWAYRGASATEPLRGNVGDTLKVALTNGLPDPTSVHWHGLALRNDMDGVPNLTQEPVQPGGSFAYEFTLPEAGTFWFHPHVGVQLDRGLYAPLIIDDPNEKADYDKEWIIVLDDWLDGVTATPEEVLKELSQGMMDHGGMDMGPMRMGNTLMGATSPLLGGDAGDVYYPLYLINGKPATDPQTFTAKPGERIRLRVVNAGGDTAFRFGVAGHPLTITHSDGFPVQPFEAESVVLGMGERYDAVITAGDGAFAVVAEALGKQGQALAVLRTGSGSAPTNNAKLPQTKSPAAAADLKAADAVRLPKRGVDRTLTLELTGGMEKYDWGINGKRMDMGQPMRDALGVADGERVALEFKNSTTMWHPMHLHGHTYQLPGGGPRKDTSIVLPGKTLRVEFDANNPGRWLTHCHNLYHGEAGMMTTIAYQMS
ncbi:multicopper oxidase family protein [Gordonia jinhuaensis]|uniref:Oxidase (Copper-binding protein) n=1 Tax=Gordonia jinhuaensis TaxID=1517702 RepID=A0A916T689_9ACTN|nr:multicopper oxidase family protein [Gordonia jinhuaensis]GGB31807.1 putative oxidase (copper-binding protein) [Gordonia jinhuaensis]